MQSMSELTCVVRLLFQLEHITGHDKGDRVRSPLLTCQLIIIVLTFEPFHSCLMDPLRLRLRLMRLRLRLRLRGEREKEKERKKGRRGGC